MKYLLSKGAEPNYDGKENQNSIALGYASHQGHKEVVKLLLEEGANPDSQISDPSSFGGGFGDDRSSCLSWAVHEGHLEVADLLRKSGATDDSVQEF